MVIVYIIIVGLTYDVKDDSETKFVLNCVILILIIVAGKFIFIPFFQDLFIYL